MTSGSLYNTPGGSIGKRLGLAFVDHVSVDAGHGLRFDDTFFAG